VVKAIAGIATKDAGQLIILMYLGRSGPRIGQRFDCCGGFNPRGPH